MQSKCLIMGRLFPRRRGWVLVGTTLSISGPKRRVGPITRLTPYRDRIQGEYKPVLISVRHYWEGSQRSGEIPILAKSMVL